MAKFTTLSALILLSLAACNDLELDNDTAKNGVAGAAVGGGLAQLAGTDVATGATVGAVAGVVADQVKKNN